MRSVLVLSSLLALSGCYALRVQPEDSASAVATKVAARTGLGVVSLSSSESVYVCTEVRGGSEAVFEDCRSRIGESIEMAAAMAACVVAGGSCGGSWSP